MTGAKRPRPLVNPIIILINKYYVSLIYKSPGPNNACTKVLLF